MVTDPDELEDAGAEAEWRNVRVPASQHGARLDRALTDGVPEFSRSYLQQLIDAGLVTVNGGVVNIRVEDGHCVEVLHYRRAILAG